ncbi:MAG: acyltransferase [Bacteroidaceae bacterium]|nr:acyltransferase [Bacteroidaceae bacterium]
MQRTLVRCLGWMNLPFVYSGMALVVPFYMLFNHQGYISQYHYFRRRFGHSPFRSFFDVYANHFRFGQIILDRFATYGGAHFKLVTEGNERFLELCDQPGGFMQIGSHVGNFELAGYMLSQEKKTINALVFGGETGTVMENRNKIFEHQNLKLILTNGDIDHVFAMNNALADGEIVSMHGDRTFGSQKAIRCMLLGAEAELPMGPYILAATHDVPVVCTFVMKESVKTYHVYVYELELPDDVKGKNAKVRAAALAQAYADRLSDILQRYPHQWLNYYEFWNDGKKDTEEEK